MESAMGGTSVLLHYARARPGDARLRGEGGAGAGMETAPPRRAGVTQPRSAGRRGLATRSRACRGQREQQRPGHADDGDEGEGDATAVGVDDVNRSPTGRGRRRRSRRASRRPCSGRGSPRAPSSGDHGRGDGGEEDLADAHDHDQRDDRPQRRDEGGGADAQPEQQARHGQQEAWDRCAARRGRTSGSCSVATIRALSASSSPHVPAETPRWSIATTEKIETNVPKANTGSRATTQKRTKRRSARTMAYPHRPSRRPSLLRRSPAASRGSRRPWRRCTARQPPAAARNSSRNAPRRDRDAGHGRAEHDPDVHRDARHAVGLGAA